MGICHIKITCSNLSSSNIAMLTHLLTELSIEVILNALKVRSGNHEGSILIFSEKSIVSATLSPQPFLPNTSESLEI